MIRRLTVMLLITAMPAPGWAAESATVLKAPQDSAATTLDPETELGSATDKLDNISLRLKAARNIVSKHGLGPQTVSAEIAWRNAQTAWARRHYLSTVRELNNYLNLVQVPKLEPYIKAQYMLGRSYEEIGHKAKALRAYFRYLSSFITASAKDSKELLEVLSRMVPLAIASESNLNELQKLLASMTSVEVPDEARPLINILAAKSSILSGQRSIAKSWIDQAFESPDKNIKAKAEYLRSLLALSTRDFDTAEEHLANVIQNDTTGKTSELAHLALARIAVRRNKAATAIKYYEMVSQESESYRDALLESIYVHLGLSQDKEARAKALTYISNYPERAETANLKAILAYLDLRAGDLKAAQGNLEASDAQLKAIEKHLQQNIRSRQRVSHENLGQLISMSFGQIETSSVTREAFELFQRLAEAAVNLAEARGELRDLTFAVGRGQLQTLRPDLVNRAEQISKLADEVLELGHRVIAAERNLYKSRIEKPEWQRLAASENRRTALLSKPAAMRRRMEYWTLHAQYMDMTLEVAAMRRQLSKAEAELAAARFLNAASDKVKNSGVKSARIAELEQSVSRMSASINKSMELLRRMKTRDMQVTGPHHAVTKFFRQYASMLHDEANLIQPVRDDTSSRISLMLADDGRKFWKRWEYVSSEVFQDLSDLDREIGKNLSTLVGALERFEMEHDQLVERLDGLQRKLEEDVGTSLYGIVSHYERALAGRYARHKKWRADLEMLEYQATLSTEESIRGKHDLETQILKDNLSDLEQGALLKWPE